MSSLCLWVWLAASKPPLFHCSFSIVGSFPHTQSQSKRRALEPFPCKMGLQVCSFPTTIYRLCWLHSSCVSPECPAVHCVSEFTNSQSNVLVLYIVWLWMNSGQVSGKITFLCDWSRCPSTFCSIAGPWYMKDWLSLHNLNAYSVYILACHVFHKINLFSNNIYVADLKMTCILS